MTQQAFTKKKNTWLKLEECLTKTNYALTINPMESFQYYDSNSIQRFHHFKRSMVIFLRDYLKPFADYEFFIELSPMGLLHLHGTVRIEHLLDFYMITIPRINCMSASSMTTIHPPVAPTKDKPYGDWISYIQKQYDLFQPLNSIISQSTQPGGIEDVDDNDYDQIINPQPRPPTKQAKKAKALRAKKVTIWNPKINSVDAEKTRIDLSKVGGYSIEY